MKISIVIPAFNEERYLPATFDHLSSAMGECEESIEIIVVDNDSTDATSAVARSRSAVVVSESFHNLSRVRNVGAAAAAGEVLVFLDADTLVPKHFLKRIAEVMSAADCLGGAADIRHMPKTALLRTYLQVWRCIGKVLGMAQGTGQFCRRDVFMAVGGYDESLFMGEDVDFFWRLRRYARHHRSRLELLKDVEVIPSPRRFDRWPLWRILLYTNPIFIGLFRKTHSAWRGWYTDLVR